MTVSESREPFEPGRLLAFNDGACGVAITLLAIDLRLPSTLTEFLQALWDLSSAAVQRRPLAIRYSVSDSICPPVSPNLLAHGATSLVGRQGLGFFAIGRGLVGGLVASHSRCGFRSQCDEALP